MLEGLRLAALIKHIPKTQRIKNQNQLDPHHHRNPCLNKHYQGNIKECLMCQQVTTINVYMSEKSPLSAYQTPFHGIPYNL